jgi:hypothetical protein
MRSTGYALTLECGQHDDPRARSGLRAILNTLAFLGLIDGPAPELSRQNRWKH